MYRIFVIEDDRIISGVIKTQLEAWGYEVALTDDLKNPMTQFMVFLPQLVLLDISLPYFNGYHWCRELRKYSKVPIIFISSASDNMNIIMAVNEGADDFIAKPFDISVLIAKVQALLRRTYEFEGTAQLVEHKGVVLDIGNSTLSFHGERVDLTKNEYRILKTLMEHRGKTVTREEMMTTLWESDSYVDDNTLTVNINRLRKKLEVVGIIDFILTKKGIGYLV